MTVISYNDSNIYITFNLSLFYSEWKNLIKIAFLNYNLGENKIVLLLAFLTKCGIHFFADSCEFREECKQTQFILHYVIMRSIIIAKYLQRKTFASIFFWS